MSDFYAVHDSQNSKYREPFGAVKAASKVSLRIETEYCDEVILKIIEFDGSQREISMVRLADNQERYLYGIEIIPETTGILDYFFIIKRGGNLFYYGNNEELLGGRGKVFVNDPKAYQVTVYSEFEVPSWYKEGIIYQIMVDRFNNGNERGIISNPKKNSFNYGNWYDEPMYIRDKEGKVARWDFFGGNLEGVIKKLPHIKSLGVTIIYFNPIFEAPSNHKYDTADYKSIDPMFGDEEKFRELCSKAEELGIKVILDGVFSHTGADSIYFNRYGNYNNWGAYESKDSPYYKWYSFEEYPDKYDCWWGFENQPNVNELEQSYIDFIIKDDDSVISKWMKNGVSGWRLDVADELPDEFIRLLKEKIKQINKNSVLIGEVWEDASNKISYGNRRRYFFGEELDSVTNYPLRDMIISFLKGNISSETFKKRFMSLKENYPRENFYSAMNIIGTHDTERILTMFGDRENSESLLKLSTALQMTLPGVPLIYYGDEAGLRGGKDPENRKAYPWESENTDILNWYKKITSLRSDLEVLKKGEIDFVDTEGGLLCYIRSYDKEQLVVIANREGREIDVSTKLEKGAYKNLLDGQEVVFSQDACNIILRPYEIKLLSRCS